MTTNTQLVGSWIVLAFCLVLVGCGCKIDRIDLSKPTSFKAMKRDYFLDPKDLANLDTSKYPGRRLVQSIADNTNSPFVQIRLEGSTGQQQLVLLVQPDAETSQWKYDVMATRAPDWETNFHYDSDYIADSGFGLIYSKTRVFSVEDEEHKYIESNPDFSPPSSFAALIGDDLSPVFVSRANGLLNVNARWFSREEERWFVSPVIADCGVAGFIQVATIDRSIFVFCSDRVVVGNTESQQWRDLRHPKLTKDSLFSYNVAEVPDSDALFFSSTSKKKSEKKYNYEHFVITESHIESVDAWSDAQLTDIRLRKSASILASSPSGLYEAAELGAPLSMSLNKYRCVFSTRAGRNWVVAFCNDVAGSGAVEAESEPDATHIGFKPATFFNSVWLMPNIGEPWREITSELPF